MLVLEVFDQLILEQDENDTNEKYASDYVVIYGGRFQPPHRGHYAVYKHLVDWFGKDKVVVATSDKTDIGKKKGEVKSPFNFKEKSFIWKRMFGVTPEFSRSPAFRPEEILAKYPEDTAYITVTSEKDRARYFAGKYFEEYPMKGGKPVPFEELKLEPYREKGYVLILPELEGGISATKVRKALGDPNIPEEKKKQIFTNLYGKFDQDVYNLITGKLEEIYGNG